MMDKPKEERTFYDWEPLARKHGYITFAGRNGFMDGYELAEKKLAKKVKELEEHFKVADSDRSYLVGLLHEAEQIIEYYANEQSWYKRDLKEERNESHSINYMRMKAQEYIKKNV